MAVEQTICGMETYQALFVGPYLGLGAWCLFHPSSVEKLCLTPKYQHNSPTTALMLRCFGAQATLLGLVMTTVTPSAELYKLLGFSMVPFFAFNAWGWRSGMFTEFLALDFIGNCIFASVSYFGYKAHSKRI